MQENELDDLIGGAPPRRVDALTIVTGHTISSSNSRPAFCECGARQPIDWTAAPKAWRAEHLREAWPLVRRAASETPAGFLARLSDLYVAASMREQGIDEAGGLSRPVMPGQPYPVITEESMAASDLVEVLGHQMNELRDRLLETEGKF